MSTSISYCDIVFYNMIIYFLGSAALKNSIKIFEMYEHVKENIFCGSTIGDV